DSTPKSAPCSTGIGGASYPSQATVAIPPSGAERQRHGDRRLARPSTLHDLRHRVERDDRAAQVDRARRKPRRLPCEHGQVAPARVVEAHALPAKESSVSSK